MQKINVNLPVIKLVGITVRTSNAQVFEGDPTTNKITATVQKYIHYKLAEKITNRVKPGTTFCAYTDYESDFNGDYTFFIGEEVSNFNNVRDEFERLTIPIQRYAKFTSNSGAMPEVCVNMWQKIWRMSPKDFGSPRAYVTDFEVYDERSIDPNDAILDIYIGIK